MAILQPMLAMFLLTLVVWTHMTRIGYLRRQHIRPEELRSPREAFRVLPDEINFPAYNLNNLVELPVAFYALCLVLYVTGMVDGVYVIAAWVFVAFRILHSVVHSTFNHVMLRFSLYMVASLALWFLVVRCSLAILVVDAQYFE